MENIEKLMGAKFGDRENRFVAISIRSSHVFPCPV